MQVYSVHTQAAVLRLQCALGGPTPDAVVARRSGRAAERGRLATVAAAVLAALRRTALGTRSGTRSGICCGRGGSRVEGGRPKTAAADAASASGDVFGSAGADERDEGAPAARHAAAGAHEGGLTDDFSEKRLIGGRLCLQPLSFRLLRSGARSSPQFVGCSVLLLSGGGLLCREGNGSRPATRRRAATARAHHRSTSAGSSGKRRSLQLRLLLQ
jgi:hypothetical protein